MEIEGDDDFSFYTAKDKVTNLYYGATSKDFKAWLEAHKTCSAVREY